LIDAAVYTVVQLSPDVNKDGGYLLLRQCVNRCLVFHGDKRTSSFIIQFHFSFSPPNGVALDNLTYCRIYLLS